jgi:hypothetical protein
MRVTDGALTHTETPAATGSRSGEQAARQLEGKGGCRGEASQELSLAIGSRGVVHSIREPSVGGCGDTAPWAWASQAPEVAAGRAE